MSKTLLLLAGGAVLGIVAYRWIVASKVESGVKAATETTSQAASSFRDWINPF